MLRADIPSSFLDMFDIPALSYSALPSLSIQCTVIFLEPYGSLHDRLLVLLLPTAPTWKPGKEVEARNER